MYGVGIRGLGCVHRYHDERVASRNDMDDAIDYASSGVDIDAEGAAVSALISSLSKSVRTTGMPGAPVELPGGFGGLVEFGDNLLALATDGVGSKLQIASKLNHHLGVGIDCVAMNVNDLLCVGCEPIAFVDYIAVPKPNPETHAAIGASLAEACNRARITLCGGETASLPGIVTELDLSGTALGWLPKEEAITGERVAEGDLLIGIPSSGFHSNGYSLVRKVLEISGADLESPPPFEAEHPAREIRRFREGDLTLGELLLNPTRIYVGPVLSIKLDSRSGEGAFPSKALHGICHITGGGLSNLLRLHPELGYHIDDPNDVLPEFRWLQEVADINEKEMYRTFNMGCGMILAVSNYCAEAAAAFLAKFYPGTKVIGMVKNHGHKVIHAHPDVVFEQY